MKKKILKWILGNNRNFIVGEIMRSMGKDDIIGLYESKRDFFEELLIRDFIGYVPKSVSEPSLKIFEEHSEIFQKWIMWQSYYVNRKALHDPMKLPKYDGMMIYLKVLYLMAENNKSDKKTPVSPEDKKNKEKPWIDRALEGIEEYKKLYEKSEISDIKESDIQGNS